MPRVAALSLLASLQTSPSSISDIYVLEPKANQLTCVRFPNAKVREVHIHIKPIYWHLCGLKPFSFEPNLAKDIFEFSLIPRTEFSSFFKKNSPIPPV